ncbi:MAG TPA: hypothetical protein VF135_04465 [Terriglobales bacterium]
MRVERKAAGDPGQFDVSLPAALWLEGSCGAERRGARAMRLEDLYLRLPIPLQNLGCTLEGMRIQHKRYGHGFKRKLVEAERRSGWNDEQVREYLDRRIADFVEHCAATVPHYRKQFRQLGISPHHIRGLDDLKKLPVLTKRQVQQNPSEFISEAIPGYECETIHTSGTTGAGLRFPATVNAIEEQWAIWWRYRRWHGLSPDTWCAYFGGRSLVPTEQQEPPFWRTNYPGKQLFFSAYHLTPRNLGLYAAKLRASKIPWLHGYPSLLSYLAAYIVDSGFDLGYQPKWITTGAENLLPHQAELIQRAFGVRPVQHYGMAEGIANISECERGRLHVDEDFAGVEFIDDGFGRYHVIGTNISNLAMPLLRYDSQDIVGPGALKCDCGKPGRIVASIDGREEDYIVLKNGAHLGRLDHIFKDMVNICEAQIVQDEEGKIVVRVVRNARFTDEDADRLRQEFSKRVGTGADIRFDYVDNIPKTAAGKLRFVISQLGRNHPEAVSASR